MRKFINLLFAYTALEYTFSILESIAYAIFSLYNIALPLLIFIIISLFLLSSYVLINLWSKNKEKLYPFIIIYLVIVVLLFCWNYFSVNLLIKNHTEDSAKLMAYVNFGAFSDYIVLGITILWLLLLNRKKANKLFKLI